MKWTGNNDLSSHTLHLDNGREIALLTWLPQMNYWSLDVLGGKLFHNHSGPDCEGARRWAVDKVRVYFCGAIETMTQFLKESEPPF